MSADSDASLRKYRQRARQKSSFDPTNFSLSSTPPSSQMDSGSWIPTPPSSPPPSSSLGAAEEAAKQVEFRAWKVQFIAALKNQNKQEGIKSYDEPNLDVLKSVHTFAGERALEDPNGALHAHAIWQSQKAIKALRKSSVNQPIHIEPRKKSKISLLTQQLSAQKGKEYATAAADADADAVGADAAVADADAADAADVAADMTEEERTRMEEERSETRRTHISAISSNDEKMQKVGTQMAENTKSLSAACQRCSELLTERRNWKKTWTNC